MFDNVFGPQTLFVWLYSPNHYIMENESGVTDLSVYYFHIFVLSKVYQEAGAVGITCVEQFISSARRTVV